MYSDGQESHGLLTLHYGKHHATIIDEIKTCFSSENFADMTFVCDDKTTMSAHKLIMASASPLVRRILGDTAHAHGPAVVHIPGIKSCHLRHLLDFLYHGQACIKVSPLSINFYYYFFIFYLLFIVYKSLQSNELDSIQELFELLQIKSDMWKAPTEDSSESSCRRHESSDENSCSRSESAPPDNNITRNTDKELLLNLENVVKKEKSTEVEDDEREEGEIEDGDDEAECSRVTERRRSSPNPVNLSLPSKTTDPSINNPNNEDTDNENAEV